MKYEIRESPSTGGGKIQVIAKPEKGKPFIAASLAVKIVENLVNFNNQ